MNNTSLLCPYCRCKGREMMPKTTLGKWNWSTSSSTLWIKTDRQRQANEATMWQSWYALDKVEFHQNVKLSPFSRRNSPTIAAERRTFFPLPLLLLLRVIVMQTSAGAKVVDGLQREKGCLKGAPRCRLSLTHSLLLTFPPICLRIKHNSVTSKLGPDCQPLNRENT